MTVYKQNATGFIKQVTKVLNELIEEMGYTKQNEYCHIDASGWTDKKQCNRAESDSAGPNAYLWDLQISVEHENDVQDWTDEL